MYYYPDTAFLHIHFFSYPFSYGNLLWLYLGNNTDMGVYSSHILSLSHSQSKGIYK